LPPVINEAKDLSSSAGVCLWAKSSGFSKCEVSW